MRSFITFWRTIVDVVALVCLVIVLYDHRDKVRRAVEWIGDRVRRRAP